MNDRMKRSVWDSDIKHAPSQGLTELSSNNRRIPIWQFAQNIPTLSLQGTPGVSVNIGIDTKLNTSLVCQRLHISIRKRIRALTWSKHDSQLDLTYSDAMIFLTVYPFLTGDMEAVTDTDIQALATQCAQLNAAGRKIFLRLAPEMNGGWYPWVG